VKTDERRSPILPEAVSHTHANLLPALPPDAVTFSRIREKKRRRKKKKMPIP